MALERPVEDIRFINPLQGGGFGAKGGLKLEPLALALAMNTRGRPVRLKYSRKETFRSTLTRHEAIVTIESGVMSDGTLHARNMEIYWGSGAYNEKSATVCIRGSQFAPGPYRIPNVSVNAYSVYTNKPVSGAFRGLRDSSGHLGVRTTHRRARQAARDGSARVPYEERLRRRRRSYWGEKLEAVGLKECMAKASAALEWAAPRSEGVGRGLACMIKPTKIGTESAAAVTIDGDGNVTVLAGTVEIGQGCDTIQSQIAAEELDVPLERVSYAPLDTDVSPLTLRRRRVEAPITLATPCAALRRISAGSFSSTRRWPLATATPRTCGCMTASSRYRGTLTVPAPSRSSSRGPSGRTGCCAGKVSAPAMTGSSWTWRPASRRGPPRTTCTALTLLTWRWTRRRGWSRCCGWPQHTMWVRRSTADLCRTDRGCAVMGVGAALYRPSNTTRRGTSRTPRFSTTTWLRVLTHPRSPRSLSRSVDHGPWGAKGVGEPPVALGPAAIGNAVANATQTRIRDLPLSPERVYWAINAARSSAD